MPAPSPVPRARELRGFAAVLAMLVLLAGCATGAPPGGLFPGVRHVGSHPARARPQPLQVGASRVSGPADASADDEDDDPEDDVDEEEGPTGAGEALAGTPPGSGTRRPVMGAGDGPQEEDRAGPVGWPDGVTCEPRGPNYHKGTVPHRPPVPFPARSLAAPLTDALQALQVPRWARFRPPRWAEVRPGSPVVPSASQEPPR
jgi:hypothetical protein